MSNIQPQAEVMMISLPDTVLGFLEGNPNIAKLVGTILIKRQELVNVIKEADNVLQDVDAFESMIESGSKEDLKNFLSEVGIALSNGNAGLATGLTEEQVEYIRENSKVNTEV